MRTRTKSLGAFILSLLAIVALAVVVGIVLIQLAWGWVVPDVFSGMVGAELLPAKITLLQSFKLSILLWALMLSASRSSSSSSK